MVHHHNRQHITAQWFFLMMISGCDGSCGLSSSPMLTSCLHRVHPFNCWDMAPACISSLRWTILSAHLFYSTPNTICNPLSFVSLKKKCFQLISLKPFLKGSCDSRSKSPFCLNWVAGPSLKKWRWVISVYRSGGSCSLEGEMEQNATGDFSATVHASIEGACWCDPPKWTDWISWQYLQE